MALSIATLKILIEGCQSTQGFPGWPFKRLHDAHTSVVIDVQKQIDSLAASYREQQDEISAGSSDELINSELSSYHSSQSSHVGSDSGSD